MRIISSNEEVSHTYVAGQRVELWCQLSRPAEQVHWYKDGEEVEVGESLVLEQDGPWCRLVLPCARPQDEGEFVCDAGGDSVFYTITVAGGCDAVGCQGHISRGFLRWCRVPQHVSLPVLLSFAVLGMLIRDAFAIKSRSVGRLESLQQLWCIEPHELTGKGNSSLCLTEMLKHLKHTAPP